MPRCALLKNVDAESASPGDAVRHIQFGGFFEFLFLTVVIMLNAMESISSGVTRDVCLRI